jgi:signal transduction histidine kinase/CheY-like chemotaxis protein
MPGLPLQPKLLHQLCSLRLRLITLILLAVLPLGALTLWEQRRHADGHLVEAGLALQDLAVNTAREQAALIGQVEMLLAGLARAVPANGRAEAECGAALDGVIGTVPWLRSLGVHDAEGRPLCAVGAPVTLDPALVRATLASTRFQLADRASGAPGLPAMLAFQPLPGSTGQPRRLLLAAIDLVALGAATRPPHPAGTDAMLLADAAGTVLARFPPAPELIGRNLHGIPLGRALTGQAGHGQGAGFLDEQRLFGFAPVPGTGATVLVSREIEAIQAPIYAVQTEVLLLGLAVSIVALILALLAGRWMLLRPMDRFAAAVRRIAGGDLAARAETGRLSGELGRLAGEVNGMAASLAAQQAALEEKNAELARLAGQLAAARDTAEAANGAKTRFVRMLSHELRTPLNGIFGHVQILNADPGLTPAQRRCAEQITLSGEHLMSMIRELLDLAAIEAGKVALAPAPLRLAGLAEEAAALIRPAATAKALAFGVEVAPRSAGWVSADPVRLRQVLLNLLGNAVKFTAQGEVVLRIRPAAGGLTRFEVSDTGPGMTRAERASLFQEFLRLAGAEQAEGSGLGLAITAKLVRLMGGTIGCDSAKGQGSLFWVELPLPPAAPAAAAEPTVLPLGEPLRLLLADDVLVNREVARALLNAAGHEVELVADGAAALDAALSRDWDAVLLDVHMPVMDGLTAARRIRAAAGPRGRVPILAVTASANQAEVEECLAAGMDAHVEKPLRAWELHNALASIRTRSLATAN